MRGRGAATTAVVALLCVPAAALAADGEPAPPVVDLGGTPVEAPSTDPNDPAPLEAGLWADQLGLGTESTHLYLYRRTMRASTVHVGVAAAGTVQLDGVDLSVRTFPTGEDCALDDSDAGSTNPFGSYGAGVAVGPDELGDGDAPCLLADELLIVAERNEDVDGLTDPLPVALRIVEEAPVVTGLDDLPGAEDTPAVPRPEVDDGGGTEGSTGFATAPYLEPGTYETTVAEGEERLWRVRLGWGQQLSVRGRIPAQGAERFEETSTEPSVELVLANPLLNGFRGLVADADPDVVWDAEEASTLVDGSRPVAYVNRFGDTANAVPGDYWVTVSVSVVDEDADREPAEVPLTLSVDVVGDAGEGAPVYPGTVQAPDGSAGPEGYAPDRPFLVAPGEFTADVTLGADDGGPGDGADGEDGDDSGASASDAGTPRLVAGALAAAGGLGLCLLGTVLLRRRTR